MLIPVRWLKDYVETKRTPQEIAHALTMVGLEVEGMTRKAPGFQGVVTARVQTVEKHPNADKLSLCRVTDGKTDYSVVCGAPNVSAGLTIALARIGAVLPGDFKIKRSKIRGVESEGMICSERELGLSEEAAGIMHLPNDLPLDVPVEDALGLSDWTLEVNITANRPDCLSILGVARELATAIASPLTLPRIDLTKAQQGDIHQSLAVDLHASDGCPRYSARRVTGVKIAPSPAWMQQRLEAAGIRPISNVVDITNFVMLETGHPMHAFDARSIDEGRIVIRWATTGEKLMTLDGTTHSLTEENVLIADPRKALALGGVMGGEHSGINDSTTDVVLEAAYFDPVRIRRTAKRLRLHTESSHRFERGCDPQATLWALDRACQLLSEHAGGTVIAGTIDCYPTPIEPKKITVRAPRVNKVLGLNLERHRMESLLKKIGLMPEESVETNLYYNPESFVVVAPTRRPDLTSEVDVIEEIARLHGYDNIPVNSPVGSALPRQDDPKISIIGKTRHTLAGLGLLEATSFPFSDRHTTDAVTLANPLKEEEGWLRTSLLDSGLKNLVYNVNHQNTCLDLFEIGRVFACENGTRGYHQEYRVAVVMAGQKIGHWRQASRCVDYYAIKGVVDALMANLKFEWSCGSLGDDGADKGQEGLEPFESGWFHPARSARLVVGKKTVGAFGELHPKIAGDLKIPVPVALAEIAIERLLGSAVLETRAKVMPPFPKAERDLAVIVPAATPYQDLEKTVREAGGRLLEEISLFDVFSGKTIEPGKKSMALSLSFRHAERTLTDAEVDKNIQRIVDRLKKEFDASLREK